MFKIEHRLFETSWGFSQGDFHASNEYFYWKRKYELFTLYKGLDNVEVFSIEYPRGLITKAEITKLYDHYQIKLKGLKIA